MRGIIIDSGHCKALGVGAEFESMMKIKSEKMTSFAKLRVRFNFSKMTIFGSILVSF